MDENFYVTLSSNACTEYYPENTVGHFWNQLASPLVLNESSDGRGWEVALTQICVPYYLSGNQMSRRESTVSIWTLPEVRGRKQRPKIPKAEELQQFTLTNFWQLPGLQKALANVFKNNRKLSGPAANVRFEVLNTDGLIRLQTPKNVLIKLGDKMQKVLGFNDKDLTEGGYLGSHKGKRVYFGHFDPYVGYRSLWVYSDCCGYSGVGGSRVPLLQTVCVKYLGNIITESYDNPRYLPVRQHYVHSIEMSIKDNTGSPVAFFPGEALVTLHFRRSQARHG